MSKARHARTGFVNYFILDRGRQSQYPNRQRPEFVAIDKTGNIFGGEPRPRVLRKYVKVR